MKHRPDARHYVYRCYGHDDRLLYIGATSNLADRMTEYDKRRSHVFAYWTAVEYATRPEAFAAERAAIAAEQPEFNFNSKVRRTA